MQFIGIIEEMCQFSSLCFWRSSLNKFLLGMVTFMFVLSQYMWVSAVETSRVTDVLSDDIVATVLKLHNFQTAIYCQISLMVPCTRNVLKMGINRKNVCLSYCIRIRSRLWILLVSAKRRYRVLGLISLWAILKLIIGRHLIIFSSWCLQWKLILKN